MSVRSFVALASIAALIVPAAVAPAAAADLTGPPGGGVIFSLCGVPPSAVATQVDELHYKDWVKHVEEPRIVDVERFDPHHPPAVAVPTYVIPQTAFLASPLCDFPNGVSPRSWYDGKVFYKPGGVHSSPDTFMIIERK